MWFSFCEFMWLSLASLKLTLSNKLKRKSFIFNIVAFCVISCICVCVFFFQLGFPPCKTEQPLKGMELQEKVAQKD